MKKTRLKNDQNEQEKLFIRAQLKNRKFLCFQFGMFEKCTKNYYTASQYRGNNFICHISVFS